jgi:hypothetical protein
MAATLKGGLCPEFSFLIHDNNELPVLARLILACENHQFPYRLLFIGENGSEMRSVPKG